MKTFKNQTYYRCEYCNKLYLRKHACEKHEKICNCNPNNWRACHSCDYLEKIDKTVYVYYHNGMGEIESPYNTHCFKCILKNKLMYPFAAEKKGLLDKYPEDFKDQTPMPQKCDDFTIGGFKTGCVIEDNFFE